MTRRLTDLSLFESIYRGLGIGVTIALAGFYLHKHDRFAVVVALTRLLKRDDVYLCRWASIVPGEDFHPCRLERLAGKALSSASQACW